MISNRKESTNAQSRLIDGSLRLESAQLTNLPEINLKWLLCVDIALSTALSTQQEKRPEFRVRAWRASSLKPTWPPAPDQSGSFEFWSETPRTAKRQMTF
jgi:hypothetical protein